MAKNVSVVKDEVPATTEDYADRYAGEGTRVDSEHTITPQVRILQGGSPQVKKASVAYVDGAAPGMIYLSSYFKPLVPGDVGIVFQPCLFQAPWDVSTPKSENQLPAFVGRYDEPQPGWTKRRSDKGFVYYLTPEGNVANQVHLHVGLVHIDDQVLPYAIRFAGTGLFISKQFNGLIGSRLTETGKPAARPRATTTGRCDEEDSVRRAHGRADHEDRRGLRWSAAPRRGLRRVGRRCLLDRQAVPEPRRAGGGVPAADQDDEPNHLQRAFGRRR